MILLNFKRQDHAIIKAIVAMIGSEPACGHTVITGKNYEIAIP